MERAATLAAAAHEAFSCFNDVQDVKIVALANGPWSSAKEGNMGAQHLRQNATPERSSTIAISRVVDDGHALTASTYIPMDD